MFEGVERKSIKFDPVFEIAAELFIHLGFACWCQLSIWSPRTLNKLTITVMIPGGRRSGTDTPYSVVDIVDTVGMETDQLLQLATEEKFGRRKQRVFTALVR